MEIHFGHSDVRYVEIVYRYLPLAKLNFFSLTRLGVCPNASNLDGRKDGRNLHLPAEKALRGGKNCLLGNMFRRKTGVNLRFLVETRRCGSKKDSSRVLLFLCLKLLYALGEPADAKHQQPRSQWVERSRVSDFDFLLSEVPFENELHLFGRLK